MWQLAEETIDQADREAIAAWIVGAPRLTQGPQVAAFERAWADWVGTRHAVFVTSGTTANLALVAAVTARTGRPKVRFGCAALTWSTNLTPALLLGHDLVLFDVDRRTLGIQTEQVCEAIRRGDIDVLFVTHLLGFCGLSQAVLDCAAAHDVLVIEDACEAHGARLGERKVGSLSLGGTFSFYFGHHMSTIEGGMVCTDDDALDDELRLFRSHGLARESRHAAQHAAAHPDIHPAFLFMRAGLNLRNTELGGFLGQRQLTRLDAGIAQRNANLNTFLQTLPAGYWTDFDLNGVSSFALPLIARDRDHRDATEALLKKHDVEHRPLVGGDLTQHPFLAPYGDRVRAQALDVTRHLHRCGLYVGNHHRLDADTITALTRALGAP